MNWAADRDALVWLLPRSNPATRSEADIWWHYHPEHATPVLIRVWDGWRPGRYV